jgi:hypothetical protein
VSQGEKDESPLGVGAFLTRIIVCPVILSDTYPLFCLTQLIIGKNLDLSGYKMRPQLFDQSAERSVCA